MPNSKDEKRPVKKVGKAHQSEKKCEPIGSIAAGENTLDDQDCTKKEKHRDHLEELIEERTAELTKIREVMKQQALERNKVEQMLREIEREQSTVLESLSDLIVYRNRDMETVWASKSMADWHGMTQEQIVGRVCYKARYGRNEPCEDCHIVEAMKSGKRRELEMQLPDGKCWHVIVNPAFNDSREVVGTIEVSQDITERKRAEQALRLSEEKYRKLFEEGQDGIFLGDAETGILVDCNRAAAEMLERDKSELIGQHQRIIHPADKIDGGFSVTFKKHLRESEGQVLEEQVITRTGRIKHVTIKANLVQIGDRKLLQAIFHDITDRKKAREELEKSKDILEKTFSSLDSAVFILDAQEPPLITDCNPVAMRIFGYEKQEMVGRTTEFLHTGREKLLEFQEELSRSIERNGFLSFFEFKMKRKDGTIFPSEHSVRSLKDDNGRIIGWVSVVRDITERKQSEESLKASEGKLNAMLQSISDHMSMMDKDLNIIWANDMAKRMFGDDIIGKKCYEVYHGRNEPCEPHPCLTLKVFKDGMVHEHDTQVVDKDGKSMYFHCSANVALRDEQGKPTAVLEISEDITNQKLAEEALRESENSYRAVVENAVEGIVVVQGKTLQFVNPALASMIGYSEEELLTRPFVEFIHPDHRDWAMGIHIKRLKGEEVPPIYELKVLDKKGNIIWMENNGILIEWHDKPATLNFLRDITERKRAEESLKYRIEFEQLITILSKSFIDPGDIHEKINGALKSIGEFAKMDRAYVFQLSDDGRTVDNTHEWCAEGIKPQIKNLKGITLDKELPWFWEKMKAKEIFHVPAVAELPPEAQLEKKHFEMQDIQALVVVSMLSKGILKGFLGFDSIRSRKTWPQDIITLLRISSESISLALDREHAEQRARLLSSTVEQSSEGMAVVDLQGNLLFLNNAFADMHGYTPEELIDRHVSVFHTPEQMPSVEAANRQVKETGKFDGEIWHVRRDGTFFPCLMHNSLLRDEAGNPIGLIGAIRDITESKRAEQALRESEERLKILFESAPDAIYLIDSDGRFMDGNNAALELVGFARDEVIGKRLAEIGMLSAGQLSKAIDNLKKVVAGKLSGPNEYTLKRKDGAYISIEVQTFPVKIAGQMLTLGIARDITEHKRTEKKLLEHQAKLKSLASQLSLTEERERHRLATDLHDQISQSLVISKIKLDQLRKSSTSDEFNRPLKDVCYCLGQIIDDTRALTFDLSYPILYELGFEAAVAEWLTDQIQEKHGIETEFLNDGHKKSLDDDIRVLLFRNVRELLINVVKHARASKVKVSIRKAKNNIRVGVEDDGIGFDPIEVTSMAAKRAEFGLFSIRERLEQLGGLIEIDSGAGRGSKITMTAPLKNKDEASGV